MHRGGVGQHQRVQLAEVVGHLPALEVDHQLALVRIDPPHDPEVAVVDLALVVVLDLHDLVAGAEGPAEALDPDLARRVQQLLQLQVQRPCPEPAPVHRAQHLDVAHRVEPEPGRDALPHDREQLRHAILGAGALDEVEVALGVAARGRASGPG